MPQPLILEQLRELGIDISAGQVNRLLMDASAVGGAVHGAVAVATTQMDGVSGTALPSIAGWSANGAVTLLYALGRSFWQRQDCLKAVERLLTGRFADN